MPRSSEEPATALRRKRVAKACQVCRTMKAKCDGKHPSCGRCTGYGYQCAYSESGRKTQKLLKPSPSEEPRGIPDGTPYRGSVRDAVAQYDRLVRDLAAKLPEPDSTTALDRLSAIDRNVEDALSKLRLSSTSTLVPMQTSGSTPKSQARTPSNSQRYLGEVSDVRFFNLVKKVLQEKSPPEQVDEGVDSYEQDGPLPDNAAACDTTIGLPSPDVADQYLDIYFSTIHIAYPFIPKEPFVKVYHDLRESKTTDDIDNSWLATLYIIFALGAYYMSFPGKEQNGLHEQFFQQALALSKMDEEERSINRVTYLLAECFYLLSVCRTDSCWTTLGLAVRVAQSIGLHVEPEELKLHRGPALLRAEMRRRIWYCLYVLDRLLSLQLGRPPAIHDDDCYLPLPSRVDDLDIDWDSDDPHYVLVAPDGHSTGDYFLSVIGLSRIIGCVLRDQHSPQKGRIATDGLLSTRSLDKQLLDWKWNLPRPLRFDFGHAFETSIAYQRQRNMLAIKFHHLRAIIHRPYLCLSLLQHIDDASMQLLQGESHIIDRYEKTCIFEAQETAHLLYNVAHVKDLVHDFPWWQMISCIICASSILLVASVFLRSTEVPDGEIDLLALNDDSETCLKVFEALSANSDGARMARDMMARLRERGHKWRESCEQAYIQDSAQPIDDVQVQLPQSSVAPQLMSAPSAPHDDASILGNNFSVGSEYGPFGAQDWPSEMLDSMTWSAQFFGAVDDTPSAPF